MDKLNGLIKIIDRKIKADTIFIFDMDGTLVDTDYANYLSYKKAIEFVTSSNTNFPYKPHERFNRGLIKTAIPNLSETMYKQIIQQKEKYYNEHLPQTKLIEFVVDILIYYSKSHKTVLVTNCREERAIITLNYHNLTDIFSYKYYRNFINKESHINKFENAIRSLNLKPQNLIVFENELFEIEEAIKAGILKNNIYTI